MRVIRHRQLAAATEWRGLSRSHGGIQSAILPARLKSFCPLDATIPWAAHRTFASIPREQPSTSASASARSNAPGQRRSDCGMHNFQDDNEEAAIETEFTWAPRKRVE
uniref:Uncharacterized protein n=1 Tax=Craspedostauros australis TaxID=1486917 RepID=A0A7R9WSH2_9STRA|mmetsp:Transcript_1617/g.4428  ORF Transcript_1617/g.4428 Transcript_1617/m.4428 type:complete len:108 (+) Transcript_1617:796-1119(+)